MVWQVRQTLPRDFSLGFADADPELNRIVTEYEELQFLNPDQERLVALRKTDVQGDLYDSVLFAGEAVRFPRPFVFTVSPLPRTPAPPRPTNWPRYSAPRSNWSPVARTDREHDLFEESRTL